MGDARRFPRTKGHIRWNLAVACELYEEGICIVEAFVLGVASCGESFIFRHNVAGFDI